MFQVLIGTLNTRCPIHNCFQHRWFQVLIGTLKTKKGDVKNDVVLEFQVLIGTLKTPIAALSLSVSKLVSSPYRYAKNTSVMDMANKAWEVSSPYRYAKNSICGNTN